VIERLRREVNKLKAERDILKRPQHSSRRKRYEVRLHCEAPGDLGGGMAVRCDGRIPVGLAGGLSGQRLGLGARHVGAS
jgi:hypothetical protein